MVIASLLAGAIEGKIEHLKEVLNRTDGKVAVPIAVQKTETKTFNLILKKTNADGTTDQLSFEQSGMSGSLESPIDVTPTA